MSRVGTNLDRSSDKLEARMMPDVESAKDDGSEIDLAGDGVHKIYLHRAQLEMYNWQARTTYVRAARGFGKTSYIGLHMMKCVLGMPRQMGGFVGMSAKQLYTRTMPNALKVVNQLGFEGFYFLGQAPAKLHWDTPLAKPRVWENCVHFSNGFVWQMLSMAVRQGSANGLNLAALVGDETKYLPWQRVKEEVLPTLRGDFMPESARKSEVKRYGFGTTDRNPYWLSQLWVSDAGLSQAQCEWEKEKENETKDVNKQIAEMLAELKYLEKHDPKMAVRLAQNDNYLRKLNALRSKSVVFWNWSTIENLNMVSLDFIRSLERQLPRVMFEIQVLGRMARSAKDGYYANFDASIHTYNPDDVSAMKTSTYDLLADKFTVKRKGTALDVHRYPTDYETEELDLKQCEASALNCLCDVDLDPNLPLRIAIDCNANLNCMVVGQLRTWNGRLYLFILRSFFTMNNRKLRSLIRDFDDYYGPLKRMGCKDILFYYSSTIKQGGATAYAVENGEDSRFDRVVANELTSLGWNIDPDAGYFGAPWKHAQKFQFMNDILAGASDAPFFLCINGSPGYNEYLIAAIENCGVLDGFRKDKSKEKLKATSEESLGGDPRTRTDITDALDDLAIGVKVCGDGRRKVGGSLRGRFGNLVAFG